MKPRARHDGVTLIEMVVTTSIALLLVLSVGNLDDLRLKIEQRIRQRTDPDHLQAALAMLHIAKNLELADRVNLIPASNTFQIRKPVIPTPACPSGFPDPSDPDCFDSAASYQWAQYTLVGEELRFWLWSSTGGCSTRKVLAKRIVDLSMVLRNAEPAAPPGGETALEDNNVVEYWVTWKQALRQRDFRGQVTIRASGYTDVPTGLQNPALSDLSPPPTPPCV